MNIWCVTSETKKAKFSYVESDIVGECAQAQAAGSRARAAPRALHHRAHPPTSTTGTGGPRSAIARLC